MADLRRAFLDAIRESPDDDVPRLIFADWLDDHGEPERAEFVRLQCELARLPPNDERRPALEERECALQVHNWEAWLGPLAKVLRHDGCTFRRGFPEELNVRPRAIVELAEEFDRRVPAARVTPYGTFGEPALRALTGCPHLDWVTGLRLSHLRYAESGLAPVAESPHLPNLAELTIEYGTFTTAGVRALATSPHRSALRRLRLDYSVFNDSLPAPATADALADPGVRFRPRALMLHNHRLGATGAATLAATENLAQVKELDLLLNRIGDEGAIALARSPHLRGLSSLVLQTNDLTTRSVRALVESPLLDGIDSLNLSVNDVGDEGAELLAACPRLAGLRRLNLFRAGITDRGTFALAASPHLANLTDLYLTVNDLTDRGSQALFDSPHLRRLERIGIGGQFVAEKIISPSQRKQWLRRLGKGAHV